MIAPQRPSAINCEQIIEFVKKRFIIILLIDSLIKFFFLNCNKAFYSFHFFATTTKSVTVMITLGNFQLSRGSRFRFTRITYNFFCKRNISSLYFKFLISDYICLFSFFFTCRSFKQISEQIIAIDNRIR